MKIMSLFKEKAATIKKANLFEWCLYLLLFIIGLNPFSLGKYFFLVLGILLLVKALVCKELKVTFGLAFVIFFSLFFATFYSIFNSFSLDSFLRYLLFPPSFFLLGQYSFLKKQRDESRFFYYLFSFLVGCLITLALNLSITVSYSGFALLSSSRIYYSIWTNSLVSATSFSFQSVIIIAMSLSILFFKFDNKKWFHFSFAILGIIISVYGSLVCANRSFFVILFFVLMLIVCLSLSKKKHFSLIFFIAILLLIVSVFVFLFLVYSNNTWMLSIVDKIPILKRTLYGGSNSARLNIYYSFFQHFYKYPFGGLANSGLLTEGDGNSLPYVHNVFLDVYALGGAIPFLLFLFIFILMLVFIFNGFFRSNKDCFYKINISVFSSLIGLFVFEPVIQGNIYIFVLFFAFYGYFESCHLLNAIRNKGFANINRESYKIVYISNFISIHTEPLHKELCKHYQDDYCFISLEQPNEKHQKYGIGFQQQNIIFDGSNSSLKAIKEKIEEADVVIYGNVNRKMRHKLFQNTRKKILIKTAERPFKKSE